MPKSHEKIPRARSLGIPNPTPHEIKKARLKSGFSQREAAISVHVATRTWINWEQPHKEGQTNKYMHPAIAELFAIKSGIHQGYMKKPSEEG